MTTVKLAPPGRRRQLTAVRAMHGPVPREGAAVAAAAPPGEVRA
ncbi:hypothetical protein [Streptomyces sp. NPDC088254]